SKKISDYTKSHLGTMMAIVIDGHLMLAVPISSEFSESALISGGMSGEEVTRLVTLLTATEIRPVD
ncbi:MAG: SecDF P1 head subdomain-containing protein, partial [Aureliella sp.]